jgi:hypothetical protein
VTPVRTEIIIRATRTQNVLGEKGRRIRELTLLVQQRFKFPVRAACNLLLGSLCVTFSFMTHSCSHLH